MNILHRYILRATLINLGYSFFVFIVLFLIIDFFDRIDTLLFDGASFFLILSYFLLKIPQIITLITPIAMLTTTLFTVGILSKNSELTAMRSSGLTILWIVRPVLLTSLVLSILSLLLSQTLVPISARRVNEIYNLDIRKKDKTGSYSRSDFWWREGNDFYSSKMFDSRNDTLSQVTIFTLTPEMRVERRVDTDSISFLSPRYGWMMNNVEERLFKNNSQIPKERKHPNLPIQLNKIPKDFYATDPQPDTMSFFELRTFMAQQKANGLSVTHYLADLYEKLSFPFITLVVTLIVTTFSILPARSGSMAFPILLSIGFSFTYYAIHSFAIALGRAEVLDPLFAAWFANMLYGVIGVVLMLGCESSS